MNKSKEFHAVRVAHDDKLVTYEIYHNNIPYIVPAKGVTLGRARAYMIVRALNNSLRDPLISI